MANDMNHFSFAPTALDIRRTRMHTPFKHSTTFNAGQLIPFYWFEALPGDTFSLDMATVFRTSTPIFPVMDNAYLDEYWFAIPVRLLWDHFKEFIGENTSGPWEQETEYRIPILNVISGFRRGTIYDQLGLPIGNGLSFSDDLLISDLPVRAYGLVWNEWFRNQNVSSPLVIPKGDAGIEVDCDSISGASWHDVGFDLMTTNWALAGIPLPVAKFPDRFTTSLPEPQKGPAVMLPFADDAPVYGSEQPIRIAVTGQDHATLGLLQSVGSGGASGQYNGGYIMVSGSSFASGQTNNGIFLATKDQLVDQFGETAAPIRTALTADLSGASAISVNTMRMMFAMQRLYETDARSGTRFREILKAHFGVTVADERVQIPEFLAGKRIPLSMTAVPQTAATSDVSPQGNLAAYSHTTDKSSMFTYSVTEPSIIMGVCCVRTDQTYSQGVARKWTRSRKFDFYWPTFANIGEQPVYAYEIYSRAEFDRVFGYQEAWSEYRSFPNSVAGGFKAIGDAPGPYAAWNYANVFGSMPTLSPEFIYEGLENVDRTLAVKSDVEDQFLADFYFDLTVVRPMPLYSIPGMSPHF